MATSVFGQILEDTETRIEAIGLTGIVVGNIVVQHVADEREKYLPALPGVIIAPLGDAFLTGLDSGGTNEREAVQYRILVVTVQAANQAQGVSIDAHLLWRQQIRRALQYKPCTITGTSNTFIKSEIEFGPVFDGPAWRQMGLVVSPLFRVVTVREGRT